MQERHFNRAGHPSQSSGPAGGGERRAPLTGQLPVGVPPSSASASASRGGPLGASLPASRSSTSGGPGLNGLAAGRGGGVCGGASRGTSGPPGAGAGGDGGAGGAPAPGPPGAPGGVARPAGIAPLGMAPV